MANAKQLVEVENRTRAAIDCGTFPNPGGSPDEVHVYLGSSDDTGHDCLAAKGALVIEDGQVAPPVRVFPAAVWTAALKLKAVAGMVDAKDIQFHGV